MNANITPAAYQGRAKIIKNVTCAADEGQVAAHSGHEGEHGPGNALGIVIQGLHVGLGQLDDRYVADELGHEQHERGDANDRPDGLERRLADYLVPDVRRDARG